MITTCCIIGSGNVATHLAASLKSRITILQVYSRNLSNASALADRTGAEPIDSLEELRRDADLYLISVPDDHIGDILAATIAVEGGIWAHTSGSVPIDVFEGYKKNYGVFYPLQTFSKTKPVDVAEVPLLIEGNTPRVENELMELGQRICRNVRRISSEQRRGLHVAAVFACNFVNYMWIQADRLMRDAGLDFALLKPLLGETLGKLNDISPLEGQTGPARRGDFSTIEKHLAMLNDDQAEVYRLLSDKIYNLYHHTPRNMQEPYDLTRIKGFVFDVDGVLSPATIPMGDDGMPARMVNIKDGYALQLAVKHGYRIAIITGGRSEAVRVRYNALGIKDVYMGAAMKLPVLKQWAADNGLELDEIVYAGDDIPDHECMAVVGLPVAPADAAPEIKAIAKFVSERNGGYGVGRDIIERVMKARGDWMSTEKAFGW